MLNTGAWYTGCRTSSWAHKYRRHCGGGDLQPSHRYSSSCLFPAWKDCLICKNLQQKSRHPEPALLLHRITLACRVTGRRSTWVFQCLLHLCHCLLLLIYHLEPLHEGGACAIDMRQKWADCFKQRNARVSLTKFPLEDCVLPATCSARLCAESRYTLLWIDTAYMEKSSEQTWNFTSQHLWLWACQSQSDVMRASSAL